MRREHDAGRRPDRVLAVERLVGIDVDRRAEPAGQDELGQGLEVDDVRAAHEHEHGARRDELEARSREERLVLARGRREHEDHARAGEQLVERRRHDPFLDEVGVGQPRVVREHLATERLEQVAQPAADVAEAHEADALSREEEGVEPVGRARASVSSPARIARSPAPMSREHASARPSAISATAPANAGAAESTRILRSKQRA